MTNKLPLPLNRPRIGRDEINLCEFPLGLLSDRPSKKNPLSLRIETGEKIWEVVGDPHHGLPTAGDVEVYVCLMELTREQRYPLQVEFTRHDLLQRLGWGREARRYDRLQLAFDRLHGVSIRTVNAYYDARDRQWLRRHAFHILEEYEINDSRRAVEADEPLAWFQWSDAIGRNLQAGYIKPLNVSLFLSLRSAISQALYRYLDAKVRDGKTIFRQNLRDLAQQHLGMSPDYWISDIKRKLAPAHEELIAAGTMTRAEYTRMQDGQEMVVYHFPRKRSGEVRSDPLQHVDEAPVAPLVQQLVEHRLALETAQRFVATWPERCQQQLLWLPFRDDLRNPAGALRRAIEEDWPPPPRWLAEQTKQERRAEQRQRRETELAQEQQAAKAAAAFDAWLAEQPGREQWMAQALAQEPELTQRLLRTHPDRCREVLREELIRISGWQPLP